MKLKRVFSLCRSQLSNSCSLSPAPVCGLHAQERGFGSQKSPLVPVAIRLCRTVCVCLKKPAEEAVSALPSLGLNFPKRLGFGCILIVFFYRLVGL